MSDGSPQLTTPVAYGSLRCQLGGRRWEGGRKKTCLLENSETVILIVVKWNV